MRWLIDQALDAFATVISMARQSPLPRAGGYHTWMHPIFRTFLFPRGTTSSKLDASKPTESGKRPCRVRFARTAMGKLHG